MTNVLLVGTLATCFILVIALGRMWSMIKSLTLVTAHMFLYLDQQDETFTSFTQEKDTNNENA